MHRAEAQALGIPETKGIVKPTLLGTAPWEAGSCPKHGGLGTRHQLLHIPECTISLSMFAVIVSLVTSCPLVWAADTPPSYTLTPTPQSWLLGMAHQSAAHLFDPVTFHSSSN